MLTPENSKLLRDMQQEEKNAKAAAQARWAAMSDAKKQRWQATQRHMGKKMQSSV